MCKNILSDDNTRYMEKMLHIKTMFVICHVIHVKTLHCAAAILDFRSTKKKHEQTF
jgi:hypothetical protein